MLPIMITSDGSCCPWSISIALFGNENRHKEIRLRIVIEAVLHKDRYLNEEYLTFGAKTTDKTTSATGLCNILRQLWIGVKFFLRRVKTKRQQKKITKTLHKSLWKGVTQTMDSWAVNEYVAASPGNECHWKTYKCSISQWRDINILKQSCLFLEGGIAEQNTLKYNVDTSSKWGWSYPFCPTTAFRGLARNTVSLLMSVWNSVFRWWFLFN